MTHILTSCSNLRSGNGDQRDVVAEDGEGR